MKTFEMTYHGRKTLVKAKSKRTLWNRLSEDERINATFREVRKGQLRMK